MFFHLLRGIGFSLMLRSNKIVQSSEFRKFGTVIMLWHKIAIAPGQYMVELYYKD
jgi:hypothetical protein